MKKCPFCAETIQDQAIKCRFCGELLQSVAVARLRKKFGVADAPSKLPVICANCNERSGQLLGPAARWYEFRCLSCQQTFSSRVTKIRSKRAKKEGKWDHSFSVRVLDLDGSEDLVEFRTDQGDVELRSGDLVIFSFINEGLVLCQNLTIGHEYELIMLSQRKWLRVEYGMTEQQVIELLGPASEKTRGKRTKYTQEVPCSHYRYEYSTGTVYYDEHGKVTTATMPDTLESDRMWGEVLD